MAENQPLEAPSEQFLNNDMMAPGPEGKSRGMTALLCWLLGPFGAHYFYLGKTKAGVISLCVSLLTCGLGYCILGLIDFISALMIAFKYNNEEFREKYILSDSAFPMF